MSLSPLYRTEEYLMFSQQTGFGSVTVVGVDATVF